MSENIQNLTKDKKNSNVLIEISLALVFVSIIIFSCLVLLGS
jgi:hypothetical protein